MCHSKILVSWLFSNIAYPELAYICNLSEVCFFNNAFSTVSVMLDIYHCRPQIMQTCTKYTVSDCYVDKNHVDLLFE